MATQTRWPTSDGDITGTWTYSSGSVGWSLVDKTAGRDDTKYIISPTTSNCRYGFGFSAFSVPAGSTINSVAVTVRGRDVTSGTNRINGCVKVGSTWYNDATANNPSTSFTSYTSTWANNPATSAAWTVSEVNALAQIGVIHSDASPALRDSEVFVVVDYTEGGGGGGVQTAGYTVAGAAPATIVLNTGAASKITLPSGATITRAMVYASSATGASLRALLYDDSAANAEPGVLVLSGAGAVISATPSWHELPLSGYPGAGDYWLAVVANGDVQGAYDTGVSGALEVDLPSISYASPQNTPLAYATQPGGTPGLAVSLYVEYQEAAPAFMPIIFLY